MIHPAISKTEIAFRYYNHWTSYNYNRETACKIFCAQEKKGNIDKKILSSIIKDIFKEQKEMINPRSGRSASVSSRHLKGIE